MPCDTRLKFRQTIKQRAAEISAAVAKLSAGLSAGRIKPKIGAAGGIAFEGFTDAERDGVTDACAYRRLLVSGSALARAAITRAEQMTGRAVDRRALVHGGDHSHDGGKTWHSGH